MRKSLQTFMAGAMMFASACAFVIDPALAQGPYVKERKSDDDGAARPKGAITKRITKSVPVIKTPPAISKAPPVFAKKPPVIVKKPPTIAKKPPVIVKKPPTIAKKPPIVVHRYHRPWRPGLRWRWIVVPTIIIAESLEWCHYHLYRVAGMRYHSNVECHRHLWWNHPSIRYVETY